MNTKADWKAAAEELTAAEREHLGGPPTPEEVVAYTRGELSEAEAERLRALFVYYPEFASILTEPKPAGILTTEELEHDRAALAARMAPRFAPRRSTSYLAIAASVLFVIAAGLGIQVLRLTRTLNEPRAIAVHELKRQLLVRGPAQAPNFLTAGEEGSWLALDDLPDAPRYRIALMNSEKRIWTVTVERGERDTVQVSLPHGLPAGTYRLEAYVPDDTAPLASYDLRVTTAAQP